MPTKYSMKSAIRTLLLTLSYPNRASYYDDWSDAFVASPDFDCEKENILTVKPTELARKIRDFDAIIMLHSTNSDTLDYFARVASVLGQRPRGRLLAFAGNEYNSPYVSLPQKVRLFNQARCDVVATQLMIDAGEFLYGGHDYRIVSVPHALNPMVFSPGPAHEARRFDLGVKGYRYPAFLGDEDRNRIIAFLLEHSSSYDLTVDISESSRLSRTEWANFLGNCRGTISTETGSWYLERDDDLVRRIHAYLSEKRTGLVISNEGWLRRMARHLPSPVKTILWKVLKHGPVKFEVLDDFDTPFAELEQRFFRNAERCPAYGKAISSRHFDAIGTKTCQIMLRGRFNDILVADEHYVAIEPDFSNADDAIGRFKDAGERRRIVDQAYEHVMNAHTHRHRTAQVRALLEGL